VHLENSGARSDKRIRERWDALTSADELLVDADELLVDADAC
jgi:hypothetical protein